MAHLVGDGQVLGTRKSPDQHHQGHRFIDRSISGAGLGAESGELGLTQVTEERLLWTPITRLSAANRIRDALNGTSELTEIAEAAAESFLETFAADTASVSLVQGDEYRSLVNVGVLFPGDVRFPEDEVYEIGYYPKASEALMRGEGYVSSIDTKGMAEADRMLKEFDRGTCMGVPLTYLRETIGEVFVTRPHGEPAFTAEDLGVGMELTRQLGFRMGPAFQKRVARESSWWPLNATLA